MERLTRTEKGKNECRENMAKRATVKDEGNIMRIEREQKWQ